MLAKQLSSHSCSLNQPHRCLPEALPTLHMGKEKGATSQGRLDVKTQPGFIKEDWLQLEGPVY